MAVPIHNSTEFSKTSLLQPKQNNSFIKTQLKQIQKFLKNIRNFLKQCKTPTGSNFKEILKGHLAGVVLLGLFAYIIKVIHIPINNMIVGATEDK